MHITFAHLRGIFIHNSLYYSSYTTWSYGHASSSFGDGFCFNYGCGYIGNGIGGFEDCYTNNQACSDNFLFEPELE